MAQLTHFDIVLITTALEEYAAKFPDRPAPTVEEALAWQASRQRQRLPRPKGIPWPAVWEKLRSFREGFRDWLVRWKPVSVR